MLQQKSLKVATETVWPTNFKIFTIYSCIKSLLTLAITYWFWCIMSRNLEIVCTFNFKSCLAACSLVSKWKGLFEIFNWFLVKKNAVSILRRNFGKFSFYVNDNFSSVFHVHVQRRCILLYNTQPWDPPFGYIMSSTAL